MLLPGPEAQQLATYIGWLMHRTLGGLVAGGLFILPGIICIMVLSYIYALWGRVPVVTALFFGLKTAVLAIVIEAVIRIGERALKSRSLVVLAAAGFVGIFFFAVPFPLIIFAAALLGLSGVVGATPPASTSEHMQSLLGDAPAEHAKATIGRTARVAAICARIMLKVFHSIHVGGGPRLGSASKKNHGGHMRTRSVLWRATIVFVLALAAPLAAASPALAQFYVRSPEVSKGELEIEEHGAFYSGAGEDEHLNSTHELEGKYGITERFEIILEGVFEDEIGEDFVAEEIELGGQYELIERHGDGFGLAFRALYEFSLLGGPDEILFGPLAKVVRGPNSATINTFFVGQVGEHVDIDSLELKVNWRLKHEWNDKWALGVEGYSEIEDLSHAGSFDEQAHRLGPVAYYEFPHAEGRPEWKAAGGVLFGASDAVSDFTYKFDLEVEF